MADPRIERLAELIVGYSLGLGPGQLLRIDGHEVAAPLIVAMHRAALAAGAHAYARSDLDGLEELMLADASEEQLTYLTLIDWREVEAVDAIISVWSGPYTR